MSSKTSRTRQRLRETGLRHQQQLQLLLREKGPLVRGSFGTRSRLCGQPSCHCRKGELHTSKYLTATQDGKVRQVHVPVGDEREVSDGVKRYRRFRKARARLAELARQQLVLIDELGESLLRPYPPENPLPAPRRRGRSRRGTIDGSH